jgi:predicted methyltransferase
MTEIQRDSGDHAMRARLLLPLVFAFLTTTLGLSQDKEKGADPKINESFKKPDLKKFLGTFEGESREIFTNRKEILAACKLKPGMHVADIGAGTGLFTRMFAEQVGERGKVYAVDISKDFLAHIAATCKEQKIGNVELVQCSQTSTELPADSIDFAFICDTYHHFEFPSRTLASLHKALKPGGQVVLIDFKRIKGVSTEWTMGHVRAGQEVFTAEVRDAGFRQVEELKLLKDNYVVRFAKVEPSTK